MLYLIVWVIIALICGFVAKHVATTREMSGGFWWGFFLGVVGLVVVAVRPNDNAKYNDLNIKLQEYKDNKTEHTQTINKEALSKQHEWANNPNKPTKVIFEHRPSPMDDIICPVCRQKNRSNSNICFKCRTKFEFLDGAEK